MLSYPTPFTPPTTEDDRLSWLRLIRSRRVGAVTFWRLIGEYGSAQAALHALPEIAKAAGVQGYEPCPEPVILKEYKAGAAAGARLLCRHEPAYPTALAELADAPPVLWCIGDPGLLSRPMVALVGARNASSLGQRMARKLAEGLGAAGVTVVSGLARGVDTAAHAAALTTGTIAVMAGGVDVTYPTENAPLAREIGEKGLRLSEQPIGLEPQARHFPLRNRIISGLARAVVVVEAAARSGSLITARLALDQGRDVFAVPGHPFDGRAAGCNMLIRDGATLVRGVEDVLAALAPVTAAAPERSERTAPDPDPQRTWRDMATLHSQILDRLGPSPMAEDQLIRDLALPSATVAPELLALELEGRIQRQPGGLLSRLD
ncbi:DNA-processing protein DprA [Defluviimonas sp. D31]|uniref:DNA-processing protein DprA n=1 Tax=Defluviimonas sp. D31 TaxID=3083253 RepID=UPI00296E8D55|nr:DNA-processing protein DprA [Defluviimonas sp. D31]MDW4548316.1 DNA-processing protein DprA [Defluviimonas sp. D31]